MRRYLLSLACTALPLVPMLTQAATPTLLNYQGSLYTSGGSPVPDAAYSVVFTIYDAASGGIIMWTEIQSVNTVGSLFTVYLGSVNPLVDTVFSGTTRYLGIKVGADSEIAPRTRLATVPYAYRVSTIDSARGGSVSGNIDLENSTAASGNVLKAGVPFLHNYGTSNTFVGENAGNFTLTGGYNTASGYLALQFNTTGTGNTATGESVLNSNTTGNHNTATGSGSLANNTTGSDNTAAGSVSLLNNTTGFSNTATGEGSLAYNTSGHNNTASGNGSLLYNSTGFGNTAMGVDALDSNTTGSSNTALGYNANVSAGAFTNSTVIGANAIVNASNKIRLGNSSVTVIEGQVAYTFTSDKNQKENFQPLDGLDGDEVLKKIASLDVSSWNYIGQDPNQFRHYGPVAQEFFAAFGHDGVGTAGTPTTINSGDMAGVMLKAIQALEKRSAEVESVRTENAQLRARLEKLEAVLNRIANSNASANSQSGSN